MEQPRKGDSISEVQYLYLAQECVRLALKYQFYLEPGVTLREHWDMPQGIAAGKSDVQLPFDLGVLMEYIGLVIG